MARHLVDLGRQPEDSRLKDKHRSVDGRCTMSSGITVARSAWKTDTGTQPAAPFPSPPGEHSV